MWLIAWNQYDYSSSQSVDIKADGDSNANYIGNDGSITNGGKNNSNENKDEKEEERE